MTENTTTNDTVDNDGIAEIEQQLAEASAPRDEPATLALMFTWLLKNYQNDLRNGERLMWLLYAIQEGNPIDRKLIAEKFGMTERERAANGILTAIYDKIAAGEDFKTLPTLSQMRSRDGRSNRSKTKSPAAPKRPSALRRGLGALKDAATPPASTDSK